MTDDHMSISEVRTFVDRHGGRVFETGHQTYGSEHITHVYADLLEHNADDLTLPENVEADDWGNDGVVFDVYSDPRRE